MISIHYEIHRWPNPPVEVDVNGNILHLRRGWGYESEGNANRITKTVTEKELAELSSVLKKANFWNWRNRFGPMFAAEIRKKRTAAHQNCPQWRWHLDEVFVLINGETDTYGEPLITRARFSSRSSQRGGIASLRSGF